MSHFLTRSHRMKCLVSWSAIFFFYIVSGATALEPPDCEEKTYGARINAQSLGDDAEFRLNFSGHWEQTTPPAELKLNDPDNSVLTFVGSEQKILRHPSYLYKGSTAIQEGKWPIEGLEENSGVLISSSPSTPLIEQEKVSWEIVDNLLIREANPTLKRKAEEALSLRIPIPSSWTDWNELINEDTLFHVLLVMDSVPDPQEATMDDAYLAFAIDGTIILKDPFERCREQPRLNWYESERLHGLIWPLGFDPAEISLQFELSLEEPRQSVLTIYDKNTNAEEKENKNETSAGGCQVVSTPAQGDVSLILLFVLVLGRIRTSIQKNRS